MDRRTPTHAGDDAEATLREAAIDMFLAGHRPRTIHRKLHRSRAWFYKTLDRYRQGGREGLRSRSRAPHHVHNRTPSDVEEAIVRLRKLILSGADPELRYANVGAEALAYELERARLTPPGRATINRILKRHGLVQPRRRKSKKCQLPDDYPWPSVKAPNELHLLDFVTRSIQGDGRFYGCNLLDQARRWPFLRAETPKSAEVVSQFLVSAWQEVGLPGGLYIDNDAVWNGGGRGQRVLSTIVRLCLFLGVEVIFIPSYTPQANAVMESFNNVWDTNFWGRTRFHDLSHLQSELTFFEHYCRHRRPLAEFDGLTADRIAPDFVPVGLPSTFDQHQQGRLPITAGRVHFIRFVSSAGTFSILNEQWQLDKERWPGKTVRATVDTQAQKLYVYYQPKESETCQLIAQFDYPLDEEVMPLADEFRRKRPTFWSPAEQGGC
jgi:transposase InsO family protein